MVKSNKKKILLIGGCGYIGSRLFQYLKDDFFKVNTQDLEWFGNVVNKRNEKNNYRKLTEEKLRSYDVVILLAGFSSVKMCEGRMKASFKNDIENFIYLLNNLTTQRFIYASSSSIYGNTKKMYVSEDYDKYNPSNFYDLNKKIIDYYAQLSKLDYYGLRLGTVCGYSPHLRIDLMINKMFHTAVNTGEITIYNPRMKRPILGIEDFCRAVKVIIHGKSNPGIYNLASFNGTIGDVSRTVSREIGNVHVVEKDQQSLYNFSVSTKKFETVYKFRFKENTKSIIRSLKEGYKSAYKTVRE